METPSPMHNNISSDFMIAGYYDRRIPSAVMLTVISVIAIPGNLLVVLVNWKAKKLSDTNVLIFIMAIIDFIGALTAVLNVIRYTLWFQILDITFCKIVMTLSYTCSVPSIYLIFAVSVMRYYHVCKHHMVNPVRTKIKYFCICVLLFTLFIAVVTAICARRFPETDECTVYEKHNCGLVLSICFIILFLSYIFCLIGLIVLNFRILQKMYQQKKIMARYRNVRHKTHTPIELEKNEKKTSNAENIHEAAESLLSLNDDLNDTIDDMFRTKGISTQDNFSDSPVDRQNEDNESCGGEFNLEEKTENFTGHQRHPRRKSTEIKGTCNCIDAHSEIDNESCKSVSRKSSTSRRNSVESPHNITNDQHDPKNRMNDSTTGQKKLHKQLEHRCRKNCLHTFTFKFQGFNRTSLKLSFVSIAYIVIYIPWFIAQGHSLLGEISEHRTPVLYKYVIQPVYLFPYIGCAINPIIYAFVDPKFRSQCRALFK